MKTIPPAHAEQQLTAVAGSCPSTVLIIPVALQPATRPSLPHGVQEHGDGTAPRVLCTRAGRAGVAVLHARLAVITRLPRPL